MDHLKRLAIPALLGVAAAIINGMVVSNRIAPHPFAVVRQAVKSGEPIESSALGRLDLPGDAGEIKASLVPFPERDVVVGSRASRDLFPGNLLLWQDAGRPEATIPADPDEHILPVDLGGVAVETSLLIPGGLIDFWIAPPPLARLDATYRALRAPSPSEPPNYRLVGPFRLLSVGGRFSQSPAKNAGRGGPTGNERVISIAVRMQPDGGYDEAARDLLDAHAQKRIMAIALRPWAGGSARDRTAPTSR